MNVDCDLRLKMLVTLLGVTMSMVCLFVGPTQAQMDFNEPPIKYRSSSATDKVAKLAKQLEQGKINWKWDKKHGWLPELLKSLEVSQKSQTLVFSKTSQQLRRINPSNPRAIYFNDDVYLGWVQRGDFVEIATVDNQLGAVFYTVKQSPTEPRIVRDTQNCLSCHASRKTNDVPGFLVRSVYPQPSGHPEFRMGTTTTDHTTPWKDRFGGWYVTGSHGKLRHRGNVLFSGNDNRPLDREAGANLQKLPSRVRVSNYLEPTSDLVALTLLEHQSQMHNRITRASFECRQALHYQSEMNRIFERDKGYRSESTTRRIHSTVEKLIEYMLFSEEQGLPSPIRGSDDFKKQFAIRAIKDRQGRSLRDFDLNKRLFKYPCSYLIYTDSFHSLPKPVLKRLKKRMLEILTGKDQSKPFEHLSDKDRKNILEILKETHPLFKSSP